MADNEGAAIEYFGDSVKDMVGAGFIYTNKNTISIGVGCSIDELENSKISLYDLLDYFKNLPTIKTLIKGGEVLEYSGHMIPEDNYDSLPALSGGGILLTGDAAGLVNNSFYHEITNLAMASGLYAAETIIEAKKENNFTKISLSRYNKKMAESFVLQDMRQYKNFANFIHRNKQMIAAYPQTLCDAMVEYFTISEMPKKKIKGKIIKKILKKINVLKLSYDSIKAILNMI